MWRDENYDGRSLNEITIPTAAKMFGVTRMSMWRWVKAGHFPVTRTPGGHYRLDRGDVERIRTEGFNFKKGGL